MSLKWFQTSKPHLQAVGGSSSHHLYFRFNARDGAHPWDRCIGTGPSPLSACVSCGAWTASASRNPSVVRWWTNSTAVVVWRSYRVCHPWSWTQGRQGLTIFAVGHPLLYIYISCYHVLVEICGLCRLYDPLSPGSPVIWRPCCAVCWHHNYMTCGPKRSLWWLAPSALNASQMFSGADA